MNTEEFKPIDSLSYSEALAELESILRIMQGDNCDIDRLSALTKRASQLLTLCRSKLTTTEKELRQILAELESGEE